MDEMQAWLKRADKEYASRKKAAEKAVARWEWATREDRAIEPLYFERHNFSRGKRIVTPPKAPKILNVAYGLDAQDRVVVERSYVLNGAFLETFFAWSDTQVEFVRFDDRQTATAVNRATLEAGRVVEIRLRGGGGGSVKRFQWEDGVITAIVDGGRKISGAELAAFQKEKKLKDLLPPLEKRLIELIPERVRALKLKEPAYSLIVGFAGEGNDMFPPTLGVGLVRERETALWNPADYEHYDTELRVDPLAADVSRQIKRDGAWKAGYQTYARIAAALRKLDWKKILPISKDFVVIAVAYDDKDLFKQLRAAAGPKTYAAWKKQRWVT